MVALPERSPVTLRVARAAKVIGMAVTQAQCASVMKRLGLACREGDHSDLRFGSVRYLDEGDSAAGAISCSLHDAGRVSFL